MAPPARLPVLRGRDLTGRAVELPKDLPDHPTVLVAGFTEPQQRDIDAWAAALPGIDVLEVVLLPSSQERRRQVIEGGMAFFLRDDGVRRRTWCLYGDLDDVLTRVSVPDQARVLVMVVDRNGDVRVRMSGPPTAKAVHAVLRATGPGLTPDEA